MAGKELVSAHAARLCAAAGFDAAVVTKEGAGNADADMALKMDALEDAGHHRRRPVRRDVRPRRHRPAR